MSTTSVLNGAEFESRLQRYLFESSEEGRAVRVGEKETSEQAAIIRRYADLFTEGSARSAPAGGRKLRLRGDERERLYRLRKTCESGLIARRRPAERERRARNRKLLAARVWFKDEEYPLRSAQAKLALLPAYADRDELGEIQAAESAKRGSTPTASRVRCAGRRSWRRAIRGSPTRSSGTRRRRPSRSASSRARWKAAADKTEGRRIGDCATSGSRSSSGRTGLRSRRARTRRTCAACRRSRRPTRRIARRRCVSTRCSRSAST